MRRLAACLVALACAGATAGAEERIDWLRIEGKGYRLGLGGLLMLDAGTKLFTFDSDSAREGLDGEIRRARLSFGGEIATGRFGVTYDFADEEFKGVWIEGLGLPLGTALRLGRFKEPFSLETLTGTGDITFLERALPEALVPSYGIGGMVRGHALNARMTWAVAGFANESDLERVERSTSANVTARVTGLPWLSRTGRFVHLGAGVSQRSPLDDEVHVGARPESELLPKIVDRGVVAADTETLLGLEFAWGGGPFGAQSELIVDFVDGDGRFVGGYAEASYVLTGEGRGYDLSDGSIETIRSLGRDGAWQLAVRYSRLDLEAGGTLDDVTLGLNAYLTSYARLTFNLILAHERSEGEAGILQGRFQLHF